MARKDSRHIGCTCARAIVRAMKLTRRIRVSSAMLDRMQDWHANRAVIFGVTRQWARNCPVRSFLRAMGWLTDDRAMTRARRKVSVEVPKGEIVYQPVRHSQRKVSVK